jgi:hypothetical protein
MVWNLSTFRRDDKAFMFRLCREAWHKTKGGRKMIVYAGKSDPVKQAERRCDNCEHHSRVGKYFKENDDDPCVRCYAGLEGPTMWEAKDAGKDGGR